MNPVSDAGVAVISLDRPDRGNALSQGLVRELDQLLKQAIADDKIHTVAFIGEGKHFCTGFDLSDLETTDDQTLLQRFVEVELFLDAIWRSPIRTAALASGRAWGAGADLFSACDVRLASMDTEFRFPGAQFGLVLGTRRLAVRVGRDEARRLTCEGRSMDAKTALNCGLANGLVQDASVRHVIERCREMPVDRLTVAALRFATAATESDADLANLIRSAIRPGLRQRIQDYRSRTPKRTPTAETSS